MPDWLTTAASTRPDHPFVVAGSQSVSFAEMRVRVESTATRMRGRGVVEDSVVALWARNDLDSIVAMLALWRAGATVQLINTRLKIPEVEAQLRTTRAHFLVGRDTPEVEVPGLWVDQEPGARPLPAHAVPGDRVAWVVFTSGSSGRPKGVRLSFDNLEASARASAVHLEHRSDDRWLCDMPIYHVGGASIVVRSLRQATTMLLEPRFDPVRAAAALRAGDATLASMVSTTLARMLDVHPGRYSGVRVLLVGGGPVPFHLLERARAAGLPALATYGMTEAASQIATGRLADGRVAAVPGAEIRTVGGRIEVRGPMLFRGYVGEAERQPDDWFETGDLGVVHDDGTLEVLGRADDVIVSGGENVHPSEVEAVLSEHPDVSGVAVLGQPDPVWGNAVVAVYEGAAAPGELERHARYHLAGYKIPRRWTHVEELPRLSMGKIDRTAVRGLLGPEA